MFAFFGLTILAQSNACCFSFGALRTRSWNILPASRGATAEALLGPTPGPASATAIARADACKGTMISDGPPQMKVCGSRSHDSRQSHGRHRILHNVSSRVALHCILFSLILPFQASKKERKTTYRPSLLSSSVSSEEPRSTSASRQVETKGPGGPGCLPQGGEEKESFWRHSPHRVLRSRGLRTEKEENKQLRECVVLHRRIVSTHSYYLPPPFTREHTSQLSTSLPGRPPCALAFPLRSERRSESCITPPHSSQT